MTWMYDGGKYGEGEAYPGSLEAREVMAADIVRTQDLDAEFERWLDMEFYPHDLYGMICDAMKGLRSADDVYSDLWGYFIEDMAREVEGLELCGATWVDDADAREAA